MQQAQTRNNLNSSKPKTTAIKQNIETIPQISNQIQNKSKQTESNKRNNQANNKTAYKSQKHKTTS